MTNGERELAEEVAELEEQLSTAHDELRGWQGLLDNPQFVKLIRVLQDQADTAQLGILHRPLQSLDGALAQEFEKGRLTGLLALTATVEGLMEDCRMTIERLEIIKHGSD